MLSDPELLKKKNVNNRTELFILRVMVGLIILYDHVHSEGAFAKGNCNICNRNTRIEIRFTKIQDCKMEIIYDSFFQVPSLISKVVSKSFDSKIKIFRRNI